MTIDEAIHEDIVPGGGMSQEVRDSLLAVMHAVIAPMFKSQQPWALIGSCASVLQGIPDYCPPDVDLATTTEGAYIMAGCISGIGATIRPVSYSESVPYASHFGIFEVGGIKVEVMGDLVIRMPDGEIDLKWHWSRWSDEVRVLHVDNLHIPVAPLEWQLVANALLGRPERTGGIAAYLLERGWNRAFLDTLLADERHGERAIRTVREVMRLDP